MNDYAKMIICFFDNRPMTVLGEYLAMHPKEIDELYSSMVDDKSFLTFKKRAEKELDIRLLNNRLTRIERRRHVPNVSQR